MSVTIRPYRRGGWEADIRVVTPDGARQIRERKRVPVSSRSAATRWAEGRERILFQRLMDPPKDPIPQKEVPTIQEFASVLSKLAVVTAELVAFSVRNGVGVRASQTTPLGCCPN